MKKSLLVLGVLAAFALLFTGCPKSSGSNAPVSDPDVGSTEKSVPWTGDIAFKDNYDYTTKAYSNQQVIVEIIPNETLKAGQTVTIKFTATLDKAVGKIQGNLVDNTEEAGWWTVLNDPTDCTVIEAGETDIDATVEYTIAKNATAAGAAKLVLYSNDEEGTLATIKDVDMTVTIK